MWEPNRQAYGRARNKNTQEMSATKSWTSFLEMGILSFLDHEQQDTRLCCPVGVTWLSFWKEPCGYTVVVRLLQEDTSRGRAAIWKDVPWIQVKNICILNNLHVNKMERPPAIQRGAWEEHVLGWMSDWMRKVPQRRNWGGCLGVQENGWCYHSLRETGGEQSWKGWAKKMRLVPDGLSVRYLCHVREQPGHEKPLTP